MADESDLVGTILLVDDDKDVREFLFQSLQHRGYGVVQASSGEEAIRRFNHFKDEIDILVTDVVMPGLHGDQLATQLVERKPGLKILLISGNPMESLNTAVPLREGVNFLSKPFTISALEDAIQQALAAE